MANRSDVERSLATDQREPGFCDHRVEDKAAEH